MARYEKASDMIPRSELEAAIEARQAAKKQARALEAQLAETEERLGLAERKAEAQAAVEAANLGIEGAARQQIIRREIEAEAFRVGAHEGAQLVPFLESDAVVDRVADGRLEVRIRGEDGQLRSVRAACEEFLGREENSNLLNTASRHERFEQLQQDRKTVESYVKHPPSIDELVQLRPDLRERVIEELGPEGRAEIVNPDTKRQKGFL